MSTPLSNRMAEISAAGTVISVHSPSGGGARDVVSLASGDPAITTPPQVVQAAIQRLGGGNLTYTDVHGTVELRAAIRDKFRHENGLTYNDDQVAVSSGSKQVMVNALLATVDPGDEVIISAPYFAPYPRMVALAGGRARIVTTSPDAGFKLDSAQLREAVRPNTKWVLLNSPNNPSGAIYSATELRALTEDLLESAPHLRFMSDEVYEHFRYDGTSAASLAATSPTAFERTLTVNSVSKSYSMTGWRIGYAGGSSELIDAMRTIQHSTTTSPPHLSQVAAVAALRAGEDVILRARSQAADLLDLTTEVLDRIPGITYQRPSGSIYLYLDCRQLIGATRPDGQIISTDADLSAYLRDEHGVLLMPGGYYGLSPYLRLTFVIDREDLIEGMERLRNGASALTRKSDP